MEPIKLTILSDIARSADPIMRAQQLFEWYFERLKLLIQLAISLFGAFLIGLILGTLRGDFGGNWEPIAASAVIAGVGLGSLIMISYKRMIKIGEEFVAALELIS